MAFYTEENLNNNRRLSDADFNVGFADYLGATIRDAWHDNPTVATIELGEVYTAQVGRDALADLMGDSFDTETDVSEFEPTASPALSLKDQQARIKEAGLEKHIKAQEGYNAEALDLIMERKREELERQITRQSASDWYAPAGFIAGLGTSMLDPINVASNFIPGVGQTRALRMLQQGAKEGARGLALRRAVIGAAEGAAGSVVVEPLVAFARSQQQADYGMTDSLLNVAFGTVMGATIHPAVGAWGDYKRKQAQKNNPLITAPWEVVPPTDKTEALRANLAQEAYARAREAGSGMTEEQAYAAAAMFDARARTWAYFENADPEAYYERWAPSFRAEAAGDGFIPPDIADFNPAGRIRDKAILYAWENGGRGHSVETASQRLAEAMRKGEVEDELKDSARAIMGQLAQMEGSVQVFGPKMGERFRYRGGELWQGMYRNKADMRTFIQNTMAGMYGKKTFIGIGELSNEAFPGYELQMTDDTVRHVLREEHAGFDDWESVVDVVNTGEAEALDVSTRVTGNKVTVYAKQYGDRVQVALVSPRSEKRRELMLLTTFNTTEKGYAQWMEGIKKDPSQTDAYILTGRGGETPQGLPTGYEEPFSEANIPQTGGDINTLLQRAWHGTPHDFDAFTLQAIGSGEGAQAHGWGLYFAKNKEVSERYREELASNALYITIGGEKYRHAGDGVWVNSRGEESPEDYTPVSYALRTLYWNDMDMVAAIEEAAEELSIMAKDGGEHYEVTRAGLELLQNATLEKKQGQLFEVEIPDDNVLLDEQKTFAEQDENVKRMLKNSFADLSDEQKKQFIKYLLRDELGESQETVTKRNELSAAIAFQQSFIKVGSGASSFERYFSRSRLEGAGYTPEQIKAFIADPKLAAEEARKFTPETERLKAELEALVAADRAKDVERLANAMKDPETLVSNFWGDLLYDAFASALTGNRRNYRAASEFLNAHGIKGITYDGRQDGRAFVVFDDKAIQILDKLYQIIGEKGAARLDRAREETMRTDNLAVAVKMAAEGKDDITIRLATGWEQGVDGKWRYEIPDGRLDFSGLKGKVQRDRYTPKGAHRAARLKDVLIMPDLYAAYPEIANIRVFTQTLPRQEHAAVQMYSDGTKVIVLNSRYAKPGKPTEAILSNIVHEVQHVIQSAEGFIQGANPKKAGGFERYEQVAGEVEARNAEGRIGFSEEERRNFLLSSTSDVPAGDMRTPDGKPLRDPRLPVEPVGPLMGREPRHALPEELPDDYDLGLPPEMPDVETPRGSVTFRPEDGKAVITFFKNTDASTLPHEMFHIFRRELAETAGMEGSSPQSRDMWAKVCEFVDAKEGEKWTVEQEEMFARAGERYLLEGKAPNAQLRGVFERMKQWFMEIYTSVDAAGMEISDTMRQVFGDMFKLSPEEADMAFRYSFGKMLEWDGTEGTDTAIPELPESDDPAMQEELTGLAVQRLEESLQSVADRPEFAEAVRKQVEQEIAELDAEMAQAKIQGDVLLEAALCDMRN